MKKIILDDIIDKEEDITDEAIALAYNNYIAATYITEEKTLECWDIYIKKAAYSKIKNKIDNYNNIIVRDYLPVNKSYLDTEEEIEWNYKKESLIRDGKPIEYLYECFISTQTRDSILRQAIIQSNLKKDVYPFLRRIWLDKPKNNDAYPFKVCIDSIKVGKESRLYKNEIK